MAATRSTIVQPTNQVDFDRHSCGTVNSRPADAWLPQDGSIPESAQFFPGTFTYLTSEFERQCFPTSCMVCKKQPFQAVDSESGSSAESNSKQPDNLTLRVCSQCKTVRYCSKSCQKQDWAGHKNFCKAWASFSSKNESDWCRLSILARHALLVDFCIRDRYQMEQFEYQSVMFGKECWVCGKVDAQACEVCRTYLSCAKHSQCHHECSKLRASAEADKLVHACVVPPYFGTEILDSKMIDCSQSLLACRPSSVSDEAEWTLATNQISMCSAVVTALQHKPNMFEHVMHDRCLEFTVIYARSWPEEVFAAKWENILHMQSQFSSVHVQICGPDVSNGHSSLPPFGTEVIEYGSALPTMCKSCTECGKEVVVSGIRTPMENMEDAHEHANIAVIFHPTWQTIVDLKRHRKHPNTTFIITCISKTFAWEVIDFLQLPKDSLLENCACGLQAFRCLSHFALMSDNPSDDATIANVQLGYANQHVICFRAKQTHVGSV